MAAGPNLANRDSTTTVKTRGVINRFLVITTFGLASAPAFGAPAYRVQLPRL